MYFDEHNPPHFHVKYNEFRAVLSIRECNVLEGVLPGRVRGFVAEWAELHQAELLSMWDSKVFMTRTCRFKPGLELCGIFAVRRME